MLLEIHKDTMVQKLRSPTTGVPLQLDIYIPSLQLAFEYQGNP